jgi:hypothetical protein
MKQQLWQQADPSYFPMGHSSTPPEKKKIQINISAIFFGGRNNILRGS